LEFDETTIGRLSESDIVMTNPYISRQHAKVVRQGKEFLLVDLKSTHGTSVNGRRIHEQVLKPGDRITLGRDQVEMRFFRGDEDVSDLGATLGDKDLDQSMMNLTSVIPLSQTESSNIEKISHILDFQYNWEKSFSAERTFRQILDAALNLSGAERGYVLLKEDEGFKFVVGLNGSGQTLSEAEFQTSHSVVQKVVNGGKPVLMTENIDQAFAKQQSILAMDLRAVACMPLQWISDRSEEAEVRGILYLDSTKTMHALTGLDQKILNKLAVEAANVFEKLELIEAFDEKKAIQKELALAQETQAALLPLTLPEVAGYEVSAFSYPTRHVGGDFYDFLDLDTAVIAGVLADVSGKGISAALLSSHVQGALQMQVRSRSVSALDQSISQVNQYLCDKSQANRFVTLFVFALDNEGRGHYVSAGHNPSYLYRGVTKEVEELPSRSLVVGAFGFATFESTAVEMEPGDVMVVYSDGITEAMNPRDELFGEERLVELIRRHASEGCQDLEKRILDAITVFTEGMDQTDDMTCVIVRKL
ncbi:MAG: SpoIIE family protein phosphatase, partial [Acidobacteriota bacterium]